MRIMVNMGLLGLFAAFPLPAIMLEVVVLMFLNVVTWLKIVGLGAFMILV